MLAFTEKNVTCGQNMAMIRTFQTKINRVTLFFCLLPATVLAVYFFWVKLPLAALLAMLFLVVLTERLIHTSYVFTDDGFLWIDKGRFSRKTRLELAAIDRAEVVQSSSVSLLKHREAVMLTMRDGSIRFLTPFPAEEFCQYFNRKKREQR